MFTILIIIAVLVIGFFVFKKKDPADAAKVEAEVKNVATKVVAEAKKVEADVVKVWSQHSAGSPAVQVVSTPIVAKPAVPATPVVATTIAK